MKVIKRGDKNFDKALDMLYEEYKGCAGGPEAEVIVNWCKQDVVDSDTVSFYATNKELSTAIGRGRKAIAEIHMHGSQRGATLYFDRKRVRSLATVIRPDRPD